MDDQVLAVFPSLRARTVLWAKRMVSIPTFRGSLTPTYPEVSSDSLQKLPSAIDRYNNEIKRVTKVIDTELKKNGSEYLVGNKCTYADIAFVSYYELTERIFMPDWDFKSEFPAFAAWYEKLKDRPAVQAAFARKEFQEMLVDEELLTGEQTFVEDEYYAKMESKEAQIAK
jgi:glutathione S-transferase